MKKTNQITIHKTGDLCLMQQNGIFEEQMKRKIFLRQVHNPDQYLKINHCIYRKTEPHYLSAGNCIPACECMAPECLNRCTMKHLYDWRTDHAKMFWA